MSFELFAEFISSTSVEGCIRRPIQHRRRPKSLYCNMGLRGV